MELENIKVVNNASALVEFVKSNAAVGIDPPITVDKVAGAIINAMNFKLGVYKASLSIGIAAVIGYITLTLVNSTLITLALALLVHASFAFAVKAITKKEALEIMSIIASIVGKR
jgi:hypothetical protein